MSREVLQIGPKILALPVVHGSADCALEVRRIMLEQSFDCLAVPLPPSFQHDVEAAIERLPVPGLVLQREAPMYSSDWNPETDEDEDEGDDEEAVSYVPIDPCQAGDRGLADRAGGTHPACVHRPGDGQVSSPKRRSCRTLMR